MNIRSKIKFSSFLPLIAAVALTAGLLFLYWPILARMVREIARSDDASYGLLLPLVSGYIVYLKWPKIRSYPWRPSWLGLVVIALGLSIFIVGELAAELYTVRFSFTVVLCGLIFLVGGWGLVRLLSFPLILLVLMLPLPELVTYKLTLPLQLISSGMATWFLQTLGIPVLRQGNIIDLGVRKMQVVQACSGLRYILSLLALGIIFCYFYQRRWWKAVILLLALVPAAIIANALRVAGMGIYPALLAGFWHGFSGWLIFIFCLGPLVLFNWILNRLWPRVPAVKELAPAESASLLDRHTTALGLYLVGALALVLLALPLVRSISQAPPVPLRQSFDNFPLTIGSWQGRYTWINPAEVDATKSNAHLSAEYNNPSEGSVSLWIAYYESQKKAGGFVHSPKGCFTASGWQIMETGITHITPIFSVNYMLAEQMGNRIVVYYWYLQRGRWLTSEYLNKFYMGYDGLLRRRTDGAIIRLITPAGPDLNQARELLASFARLLVPVLPQFIPD